MGYQNIFKRYEIKYLLTMEQKEQIKEAMAGYMSADTYGRSTICNIYYDTPDFLLARRSIERPVYKEKLRLRSYGIPGPDSTVFVELKKKYQSVVYKRRISMKEDAAIRYLNGEEKASDTQITREMDYFLKFYQNLQPKVVISYEREAFYARNDHEFRVTFDENILWRDYDLSLLKGAYGEPVLRSGQALMEIKTGGAIPIWMSRLLNENQIYKASFSKYGSAYKIIYRKNKEAYNHV